MTILQTKSQRGFTLAEMMVAMVIGLLVTLAVSSLFLTSRKEFKRNDATTQAQENARFALEMLTNDLRHAGFFGNIPDPIDIDVETLTLDVPSGDCGRKTLTGKAGLYNFTSPSLLLSFGNQIADVGTNAFFGTCLDPNDVKPDSSILIVKRVAGNPTAPLTDTDTNDERVNGRPYVYANGSAAVMYSDTSVTLPFAGGQHWEYLPRIYYIDKQDHLKREQLDGLKLVNAPLANGVEALHVEFGIDTLRDGVYDGAPDYFITPAVNADPDAATDMNQIVSATVYVLVRTTTPDPNNNVDTNSYQLGVTGPTIGPLDKTDLIDGKTTATLWSDYRYHYKRRVYSTTVALKNIRNQVMSR